MGSFATGITIVTSCDATQTPVGLTASSLASVSKEPPLVLVCIGNDKYTLSAIRNSGLFAVNLLKAGQADIARLFASSATQKFSELKFRRGVLGAPLLDDALAYAECSVFKLVDAGDHAIVIGKVVDGETVSAPPLLHFRGQLHDGSPLLA
jgi:flavin reductase (DIM6/NTAB) family NADH-FMN oxidoreductase RutF